MQSSNSTTNPKLFTKPAIFFAALVLSPFFGTLLFLQNLWEAGKSKQVLPILIFGAAWNIIIFKVAWEYFLNNPLVYLIGNTVGGFILIFPLWRWLLGDLENYERKSIWSSPLLILIAVLAALMALSMWFRN